MMHQATFGIIIQNGDLAQRPLLNLKTSLKIRYNKADNFSYVPEDYCESKFQLLS